MSPAVSSISAMDSAKPALLGLASTNSACFFLIFLILLFSRLVQRKLFFRAFNTFFSAYCFLSTFDARFYTDIFFSSATPVCTNIFCLTSNPVSDFFFSHQQRQFQRQFLFSHQQHQFQRLAF